VKLGQGARQYVGVRRSTASGEEPAPIAICARRVLGQFIAGDIEDFIMRNTRDKNQQKNGHRKKDTGRNKSSSEKTARLSLMARALEYASLGLPVLPMHTCKGDVCTCPSGKACDRPGKHPMTPHGVKDATTNLKQIERWWSENPRANIGIAPGTDSDVLVLDIDPRNDGGKTLAQLEKELGTLPETVTAFSGGGGYHLLFKHPAFAVRKDSNGSIYGPGIDILGDGCIMIAPPSSHVSGKKYRWAGNRPYHDLQLAELPNAWLDRLRPNPSPQSSTDTGNKGEFVLEGLRNNHLTSLAGTLRRGGATPEALAAALTAENAAKCSPPLDAAEIAKIVASVSQYQPGQAIGDGVDSAEMLMQLTLDRHFNQGKHLMLSVEGRFWHYDVRLWRVVPDQWVSGKVLETIQSNPVKNQKTAALLGQVLTLLRAKLAAKDDLLGYVADPPPVINCTNGELWIRPDGSVELRPHRPESYLRHCLDVAYDAQARCPKFDKAVAEIFGQSGQPESMVRHWNEFMGYVIQPRRNIPVIAVLRGGGDNGKTVLIRTLIRLLGNQLVHAQRVEDLDKNRFAMGSLFGKLLFVDDDVRAGVRLPDGTLKTISEAKEVTGELKYQPAFNFVVRTVPVLLCNNVPSLADLSHGMLRRLMVFPFDRRFTDVDKDPDLFEGIWANELPGVLNQALAGYKRVVERGSKFKRPAPVKAATTLWLQHANPLPAFIAAHCVPKDTCLLKMFYEAYSTWTREMGYTLTQTQQVMTRNLEHLGYATKKTNKGLAVIGLSLDNKANP
jgi:putative DNA primase/helicase